MLPSHSLFRQIVGSTFAISHHSEPEEFVLTKALISRLVDGQAQRFVVNGVEFSWWLITCVFPRAQY